jgi:hypothetical protein
MPKGFQGSSLAGLRRASLSSGVVLRLDPDRTTTLTRCSALVWQLLAGYLDVSHKLTDSWEHLYKTIDVVVISWWNQAQEKQHCKILIIDLVNHRHLCT